MTLHDVGGGQREKKDKKKFTELALNMRTQTGKSRQQMVGRRRGGVNLDGTEKEGFKGKASGGRYDAKVTSGCDDRAEVTATILNKTL